MTSLTAKERAVYEYVRDKIDKDGYSPSIRDIRGDLGIKSTSSVHTYLSRLEEKGLIKKQNGKSRTLRLGGEDTQADGIPVPLLGSVTAGMPILAVENREGRVFYSGSRRIADKDALFALRIKGESMIGAGILDGDVVIVERTPVAENGQIVVALIGDEATVKRFFKEDGKYRLQPENPAMDPIIVDEVTILGVVISSVRYYD